jgi:hypothetical protein
VLGVYVPCGLSFQTVELDNLEVAGRVIVPDTMILD